MTIIVQRVAAVVHAVLGIFCLATISTNGKTIGRSLECGLYSIHTYSAKDGVYESNRLQLFMPFSTINSLFLIALFEMITAAFCMTYSFNKNLVKLSSSFSIWIWAALAWLASFSIWILIAAFSDWGIPGNNILYFGFPGVAAAAVAIIWYSANLSEQAEEGIRYIEYSITASLLLVAFCTPVIRGLTTLDACCIYLCMATLNIIAAVPLLESYVQFDNMMNKHKWNYLASWILFVAAWFRFLMNVFTPFTIKHAPAVAWASICILFGFYSLFGLLHLVACLPGSDRKAYLTRLDVASLVVKTVLSGLALGTSLFAGGVVC
jgi:hypothetical protein